MQPYIEIIGSKKLIGCSSRMSVTQNTTPALFSKFMPRRKEIQFPVSEAVYDIREYPEGYFIKFNPDAFFVKWALIEVTAFNKVPAQMQTFTLPAGKYAVFKKNPEDMSMAIFQYIFTVWLPNSAFNLDDRPHFEKFEGIDSEKKSYDSELIYIPIVNKTA